MFALPVHVHKKRSHAFKHRKRKRDSVYFQRTFRVLREFSRYNEFVRVLDIEIG